MRELFGLAGAIPDGTALTVDQLRERWVARTYESTSVDANQIAAARRLDRLVTAVDGVVGTRTDLVERAHTVGFGDRRGATGWSDRDALQELLGLAGRDGEALSVALLRQRWVGQTYGLASPDSAQVAAAARLDDLATGRSGVFAPPDALARLAREVGFGTLTATSGWSGRTRGGNCWRWPPRTRAR